MRRTFPILAILSVLLLPLGLLQSSQAPAAEPADVESTASSGEQSPPAPDAEEGTPARAADTSEASAPDAALETSGAAAQPSAPAESAQQQNQSAPGTLQPDGAPGDGPPSDAPILDSTSRQISFQALLKDNAGVPLPGPTVNLRFQLYTSPGGVAVGAAIDVNNVPITNGIVDTQVPVPAGSLDGTGRELGVRVNLGAELTPRMKLSAVPHAYRVDRVASEELDDSIALGRGTAPMAAGLLNVHNGTQAQSSVELSGAGHRISTYGSDGLEQIRLWGPSWGELWLNDQTDNDTTVFMSASSNSGGTIELRDATGGNSLSLTGATGKAQAEDGYYVTPTIGGTVVGRLVRESWGGRVYTQDEAGLNTSLLGSSTSAGGFLYLYQSNGTTLGMDVDGDASGAGGGANLSLRQANGTAGVNIDADDGNANGGGLLNVHNSSGAARVRLDGQSVGTGGEISVFDADGTETVEIVGAETNTQGGQILLRRADGTTTIELDADFNGDGRIVTQELQITGGSDLSEQFDVTVPGGKVEPGMVVCIDPNETGKLVMSRTAYDRTVAGVISGAGGVKSGMMMGQRGTQEVDGRHPVALTGRVYVWCDVSGGAIQPGDLVTTSQRPGHGMRVSDHTRAQGAVLGKAMSSLKEGRGLVLVLVSLQ